MTAKKQTDKRSRLKSRVTVNILITALISFSIMGIFICKTISYDITEQVKENLKDIAVIAAGDIDGDTMNSIDSESDPEYAVILDTLRKYEKTNCVDYIYTMKMQGDNLVFVVDADYDSHAPYGTAYKMLDEIRMALNGSVTADKTVSSDEWNKYISAYAPVYASDGSVAGIVGVDTFTDSIDHDMEIIRLHIICLIALFLCICLGLIFGFWADISKRDMLTGVMNYDSLVEQGDRLHKKKVLHEYSVIQLNIRNFKYINSEIGTSLGDVFLVLYANILSGYLGRDEYCARTGSDNFIILIRKGREEDLIEKMSETWIDMSAYNVEKTIQVPLRCGIYDITEKDTMQDSVNYSSVALKHSRSDNSNYITRFESSMLDSLVSDNKIIAEFRNALSSGEFQVYYQPKVNISTNELCGAEALVRWIKGDEVIPPNEFIPALEAEGLVTELDFYVFETVCRHICAWEDKKIKPVTISSNFSKLHLANPNFADSVLTITNKYGIAPELLEIELTESSGYANYDALTSFVRKMNQAKIHTSIDDFGTGYSSLSMLKDISVDVVKIDKSFLDKKEGDDSHQEKMLENVIRMINDLDRTVICEGIENESQLSFLRNADCSVVQGYYFDKPLPHDEFEKRLQNPHYS